MIKHDSVWFVVSPLNAKATESSDVNDRSPATECGSHWGLALRAIVTAAVTVIDAPVVAVAVTAVAVIEVVVKASRVLWLVFFLTAAVSAKPEQGADVLPRVGGVANR